MKNALAFLAVAALLSYFLFGVIKNKPFVQSGPVTIAVIDTGVNTADPKISASLDHSIDDSPPGWNFFGNNDDVKDNSGHGTDVALSILEVAQNSAKIIPIKVTEHGPGVRPKDLVNALNYAKKKNVKLIQLSLGISDTSPELEAVSKELAQSGTVMVAAAGAGVSNPFRGEDLNKVYPQAYSDYWVVIGTVEDGKPLPNSNFGKEILVNVEQRDETRKGSSFVSAKITGLLAARLSRKTKEDQTKITNREVKTWLKKSVNSESGVLSWKELSQTPLTE